MWTCFWMGIHLDIETTEAVIVLRGSSSWGFFDRTGGFKSFNLRLTFDIIPFVFLQTFLQSLHVTRRRSYLLRLALLSPHLHLLLLLVRNSWVESVIFLRTGKGGSQVGKCLTMERELRLYRFISSGLKIGPSPSPLTIFEIILALIFFLRLISLILICQCISIIIYYYNFVFQIWCNAVKLLLSSTF